MSLCKRWWLLLCVVVALPSWADAVRIPAFERVVLNNGATLLLMERHDVPLIAFQAVVRGGVLSETADTGGGANILVQLLSKGSGKRDATQFADAVAQVGGSFDSSVDTERWTLEGSFLARDQALMIELLADALMHPRLEQSQFDDLRTRQIEFLRAAKDSNLGALTPMYAAAALFGSHPYGRPDTGSEATLAGLRYGAVQRLYRQQFGADRLILAVAGDFDTKAMLSRLRQAFGSWHQAKQPLPSVPVAGPSHRRVVLIDAPDSVQTYFWIGNVSVAHDDQRRVALDLINTLFGGRFTSMLNTELRIKSGLTYGARSQSRRLSAAGSWNMYSFTQTAHTVQAIDLALDTYRELSTKGFDDAGVSSGKNYILGQFPTKHETAAQWADTLADLEFYRLPRSEIDAYADRLNSLTREQLKTVIDQALPAPDDLLLVLVGNAAAIRDQVAKYGPIVEMPLSAPGFRPTD